MDWSSPVLSTSNLVDPDGIQPWAAACIQGYWENYNPNIHGEFEGADFKKRNLRRMCDYIDACFNVSAIPKKVALVAFPEFSIGGLYNTRTTVAEVQKYQAITIPGPETEVLAAKAREHNVYLVVCNNENDPAVPDYFFNTAFIINPEGKIILKYRKQNARFACTSHDLMARYRDPLTGKFDPFPVVETRLGRLSCMICGDINIPEIPRVYAIKGADAIIRCDSGYGNWDMAQWTLRVRSRDNKIYIINENWSARVLSTGEVTDGHRIPELVDTTGGGGSAVFDFEGRVIAQANGTAPQIVSGMIDVMALRRHRALCMDGVGGIRTELYSPYYARTIYPPNRVIEDGAPNSRSDPKKRTWDNTGRANVAAMADYYHEDDVA